MVNRQRNRPIECGVDEEFPDGIFDEHGYLLGELANDGERIGDAARPHGVPDAVDFSVAFSGDHWLAARLGDARWAAQGWRGENYPVRPPPRSPAAFPGMRLRFQNRPAPAFLRFRFLRFRLASRAQCLTVPPSRRLPAGRFSPQLALFP